MNRLESLIVLRITTALWLANAALFGYLAYDHDASDSLPSAAQQATAVTPEDPDQTSGPDRADLVAVALASSGTALLFGSAAFAAGRREDPEAAQTPQPAPASPAA